MLNVRDKTILNKIVKYSSRIENKISKSTKEKFALDEDLLEIVCFNILQIGEAVKSLSEEFTKEHNEMQLKKASNILLAFSLIFSIIQQNRSKLHTKNMNFHSNHMS